MLLGEPEAVLDESTSFAAILMRLVLTLSGGTLTEKMGLDKYSGRRMAGMSYGAYSMKLLIPKQLLSGI